MFTLLPTSTLVPVRQPRLGVRLLGLGLDLLRGVGHERHWNHVRHERHARHWGGWGWGRSRGC